MLWHDLVWKLSPPEYLSTHTTLTPVGPCEHPNVARNTSLCCDLALRCGQQFHPLSRGIFLSMLKGFVHRCCFTLFQLEGVTYIIGKHCAPTFEVLTEGGRREAPEYETHNDAHLRPYFFLISSDYHQCQQAVEGW